MVGNRTEVWENGVAQPARAYNAANQVVGWSYDAAGNLLSTGSQTFAYDALNRLSSVTPLSGSATRIFRIVFRSSVQVQEVPFKQATAPPPNRSMMWQHRVLAHIMEMTLPKVVLKEKEEDKEVLPKKYPALVLVDMGQRLSLET